MDSVENTTTESKRVMGPEIPPESWVMRPARCSYCNYIVRGWNDPTMREDMIRGQSFGWMYCTNCEKRHNENKTIYVMTNGYTTMDELMQRIPSLKPLHDRKSIAVRIYTDVPQSVQHSSDTDHDETIYPYAIESEGWMILDGPKLFCGHIVSDGKLWIRLYNCERRTVVMSQIEDILYLNKIPFEPSWGNWLREVETQIHSNILEKEIRTSVMKYIRVERMHHNFPVEIHV